MKGFRGWGLGFSLIKISFILVVFLYPIPYTLYPAFASEDIGYSKIHPASPFYFLKTIRESLELKFAFTPRVKGLRQLEFATRRLREARTIIQTNPDLIPPTLEKYSYHLNILFDKNFKNEEVLAQVNKDLITHLEVLQQIYNESSDIRAKMAIRSTINRIIIRANISYKDKLPVCTFFAKEASAAALNQTEKFVIQDRAQRCFDSLGKSNS